MTYLRNWADISDWMNDNGIVVWNVSRTQAAQDNNKVFMYDEEKSLDENRILCERALNRFAGDVLYIVGWRTPKGRTGGYSATILYSGNNAQPETTQQRVSGFGGLYGFDDEGRRLLVADITNQVRNEYDRREIQNLQRQLEEERKAFRDERREFEKEKLGAIGILVDKFAPYLKAVAGKHGLELPKVAGIDADTDVEAARIHPAQQAQQPGDASDEEQGEAFSDTEADELLALMTRFKSVEQDYLQLLKAVVEMAESGDKRYLMAKQFLLTQ